MEERLDISWPDSWADHLLSFDNVRVRDGSFDTVEVSVFFDSVLERSMIAVLCKLATDFVASFC